MPEKATWDGVTGGVNLMKFMCAFLISFSAISFFISFLVPSNLHFKLQKAIVEENDGGELIPRGIFDENSCLSRYQYQSLRRGSPPIKPSPYLISKLRSYEARHKRCAPYTDSYNKTLLTNSTTCKYVVWISLNGLGNKMLTLASAFLYALLTDRVLLLDRGLDIPDLFCEPFPEASWFLPTDFPFTSDHFNRFVQRSNFSYGNVLKRPSSSAPPHYMHLYLCYDYDGGDKRFFCDEDQAYLHQIPWLIMKSDQYFVPSLFLMPSFQRDLQTLFPDKGTVFHLLSRYLFHPTNPVWGIVTRYYQAYLSNADVITGIQIRIFSFHDPKPAKSFYKHVMDQILNCTARENILPQIIENNYQYSNSNSERNNITVAVLMTSLSSGYYEHVREMYMQNPTAEGEVVGVFQPSHEEVQQTGKHSHNQKALAEIYLLSLTDKLVTSGWSTFGYVAQGIGGLKPWILYKPENGVVPEPPCGRVMSMEPCFMFAPFYDCKTKGRQKTGSLVPYIRQCEDIANGVKLVQS